MTVRLVLVTHAPTTATQAARFPSDEPLNERGAADAQAATGMLRRIERVYRGGELRCAQTASALGLTTAAHAAHAADGVEAALADWDLGVWQGHSLTELQADRPGELLAWLTDPAAAPHGGETLNQLLTRAADWLATLTDKTTTDKTTSDGAGGSARIAAVTHPALVRAVVTHVLKAPPGSFWRIDAAPLSQTWLSYHHGRWQLRETGHPLTPATAEPD
jgi:broad specificity phosphatase PhoE